MKGRRDEHNGGAGRNSGEPITMALLGDTAEDVTERNGRTQRRNTTWSRVKKRGRRETERGTVQTERERERGMGRWEGGSGANPELGYLFVVRRGPRVTGFR